jgi:hypothetical protein
VELWRWSLDCNRVAGERSRVTSRVELGRLIAEI